MCITRLKSGTATYRFVLSVMELPKQPDHQPPVMLDGMEQERYVVKSRFLDLMHLDLYITVWTFLLVTHSYYFTFFV